MTKFIISILFLMLSAISCKNAKLPDVSGLMKECRIQRLDQDLFALDPVFPSIDSISRKYGHYFEMYIGGVLDIGSVRDTTFRHLLPLFLQDSIIREVYDSVQLKYPDMKRQEKEFSEAWAYYTYYFPSYSIPRIYTHISGFNQSVIVDTAAIGIGLDNYLGENCNFYSMLAVPVPMYARKKMTERDIVKDALAGWLSSEFIFCPIVNDFVSGMLYQGKIIYTLEKLLPGYEQSLLFGFTSEQLSWCEANEEQIWSFLVDNKHLFSTQQRLIIKYLNDAPFTSGMPMESPGKAVVWTGYQIVKKYIEKTNINPEELMEEQDYHKILRVAGYRP